MPSPRPLIFAKFLSSQIGDGLAIRIDRALRSRVDWEVALAAMVDLAMARLAAEDALSYIFGYMVNDVATRDVQFADGLWVRGKSFDRFCPRGPVIVVADDGRGQL